METDLPQNREAVQALADALTEGTDLDVKGAPDRYALEIAEWLASEGWSMRR